MKSKKYILEKINIYIRIIEIVSKKNCIPIKRDVEINQAIGFRIKELNFINNEVFKEILNLEKGLKKNLFKNLIDCVAFELKNKKIASTFLKNIDPIQRKNLLDFSKNQNKPSVVDLFCGAGGMSLGFAQADFQIALANDNDEVCIETYKYNHPEVDEEKIISGDINKNLKKIQNLVDKEIDVVIGGPPCQGFSSANQQRLIDDPRNNLYKSFIKVVESVTPKFVVMENVKGMLPFANQVKEDFEKISNKKNISYKLDFQILVSDNFGVAQRRQRLIFIAIRNDVSLKKNLTPQDIFTSIDAESQKIKKFALKDALRDIKPLKAPRIKNMTEIDDEVSGKKIELNQYEDAENDYLNLINGNKKIDLVFNHKARYVNDINYEIYSTLEQGEDGTNDKIQHIMPYKNRNHIFKDKYYKLDENKPCKTITAHLKMDCHSHIHPTQTRSLTPREAARVQSFPDDYFFLGPYLKTYMQIGNAVPPLMAKSIAKELKKHL